MSLIVSSKLFSRSLSGNFIGKKILLLQALVTLLSRQPCSLAVTTRHILTNRIISLIVLWPLIYLELLNLRFYNFDDSLQTKNLLLHPPTLIIAKQLIFQCPKTSSLVASYQSKLSPKLRTIFQPCSLSLFFSGVICSNHTPERVAIPGTERFAVAVAEQHSTFIKSACRVMYRESTAAHRDINFLRGH